MKHKDCLLLMLAVMSCACSQKSTTTGTAGVQTSSPARFAAYASRIGVGVSTESRTCLSTHNDKVGSGTKVVLVSAINPQKFVETKVEDLAQHPCPITEEVDTSVSSYNLHSDSVADIPKMQPLIVVFGDISSFRIGSSGEVLADIGQDGGTQSFRACSSPEGVQLTVWSGQPLTGAFVWHGFYYEPGNPGAAPACTPAETTGK